MFTGPGCNSVTSPLATLKPYQNFKHMKIIRISNESHSAFKDLCIREKKGLTDGAEIIISKALKRGTLNEVKKDVFSQIQSLENTFRSWMKQQEKTHLRGIEEDLLILSKRLKDVSTRTETQNLFETGIQQLNETTKASLSKYEAILHRYGEQKSRFLVRLKHCLLASIVVVSVYFFSTLVFDFISESKRTELEEISTEYNALREFCKQVEASKNIKILQPFDEEWSKYQDQ